MAGLAVVAVFAFTRAIAPVDRIQDQQPPVAAPPGDTVPMATLEPVVATPVVPSTTSDTTPSTPATTSTTAPPSVPVQGTAPPAPTTAPPPPTTEPPVPEPTIAAVGDPVPISELRLSVLGIGPLEFGDPADVVLGVLASSLGQPDFDSGPIEGGDLGTCEQGSFRVVRWGALEIVTRVGETEETFDAFKIDLRGVDDPGPSAELPTLSGFVAGRTIEEFETVYVPGFRVAYLTDVEEGLVYELSSAQGLLLWGPITSSDPTGVVQGIFSFGAC